MTRTNVVTAPELYAMNHDPDPDGRLHRGGGYHVDGLNPVIYHAHPALSSSQARDLLRTPALYRWRKDHPIVPTRDMELGTCVHTGLLGVGQDGECNTNFRDYKSKAAQQWRDECRAAGVIPLLADDGLLVQGMASAVRAHPLAGPLLDPDRGTPERAVFWRDEVSGVDCRALIDFSPHNRRSLVDLKTTADASPAAIVRHMANYGYPIQAAWYLRGARAAGLADEQTGFVWVFVERAAPHLVSVATLAPVDLEWADDRCRAALERYRDCEASGVYPGYGDDINIVRLPNWARRDYEEGEQ